MEMKSLIRGDINGAAMNETVDKWGEGGVGFTAEMKSNQQCKQMDVIGV